VGLKDLLGRRKAPASAARDRLFALSTAQVTLRRQSFKLGGRPA